METIRGEPEPAYSWTIFTDRSSNRRGSKVGLILENEDGITIKVSLRVEFPTTNNQSKYEVVIVGLTLASEIGAESIKLK